MLRIGHDRYVEGLQRLVQTIQRESQGHTRALIQIIDFLNIRRRPEPAKYFERFLRITPRLRLALGAQDWSEEAVREHLTQKDPQQWPEVLASLVAYLLQRIGIKACHPVGKAGE